MSRGTLVGFNNSTALEQQVRQRIQTLAYLPTTVAVAMKFIELGKDPDAEPADYARVISADSSLCSKLLALANSSWFGVRNKITRPQMAVNLLGLGTVRTLAVSYCLTGLHSELRLSPDESRRFWTASLCKAVAAKRFIESLQPKLGEEAFAAALFQDFAIALMFATARDVVQPLLDDAALNCAQRLEKERELFHLDHAEIGRLIAQKLELPEVFVDSVAFHHNLENLREFSEDPAMADAMHVAALFPHTLNAWNTDDAQALQQFLAEHPSSPQDVTAFLKGVQQEFNHIYSYFEDGRSPEACLTDLLQSATREAADSTTRLVCTVHELLQEAAVAGREMRVLINRNTALADASQRDPLTGALNRDGLAAQAAESLASAARYGAAFGVAYLDLDQFKLLNDTHGHHIGDAALKKCAEIAQAHLQPTDVLARVGGDEFVILLLDRSEDDARQTIDNILRALANEPLGRGSSTAHTTASAGLLWVTVKTAPTDLPRLVQAADQLMYQAKHAGGNRLHTAPLTRPFAA